MTQKRGDGRRLIDWSAETVEVTPAPPRLRPPPGRRVQYDEQQVVAYFDSAGQPAAPAFAAYAKVWTPDGNMRTVSFDEEAAE